jgi:hypothetical protein
VKTYGIIGSGKCGENIIEDGLAELSEDAQFLIYGRKGASSNEDRVYDYLLEHELPFKLFVDHGATVPKVLTDAATETISVVAGTVSTNIIKFLTETSGELLVLWDETMEDIIQDLVFRAYDSNVLVKELTNGLIPINVSGDSPKDDIPAIEPFSKEELRSMSIGVLRKAAGARGIENANEHDKDELIALITGEPMPTTTSATPMTAEVKVDVQVPQTERTQLVAPEGDCMVTVVMPNGTVISTPATMEEVRVLLGLSGGS